MERSTRANGSLGSYSSHSGFPMLLQTHPLFCPAYISHARVNCCTLERHTVRRLISRARLRAGPETQDRLAATIAELRDQLDDDVNELYRAP